MDKRFISEDQGRSSPKGQETISLRLATITHYLSGGHGQGAMINALIVALTIVIRLPLSNSPTHSPLPRPFDCGLLIPHYGASRLPILTNY
uniref:Uncharacterized protein n=1 Tax=Caenorhabditis japonica TaxID=281687 RepID=A0A8R1IU24_CAEJA